HVTVRMIPRAPISTVDATPMSMPLPSPSQPVIRDSEPPPSSGVRLSPPSSSGLVMLPYAPVITLAPFTEEHLAPTARPAPQRNVVATIAWIAVAVLVAANIGVGGWILAQM